MAKTPFTSAMRSPIIWMGSKRRLAPVILPMFPVHSCYVEVFAGSGSLLFAREDPAKTEVLNDIDGELVNFFRTAKHHLVEFCNQFRWAVTSRKVFDWCQDMPPEPLTEIQRAARFYYLQRLAFGGKKNGPYGYSTTSKPKLNLVALEETMSEVHTRLAGVNIENLDWQDCIARYDRPHTLFYCDPPYWSTTGYGTPFVLEHYDRMADLARTIKGKMIISVSDHPEMRRAFAGLPMREVPITYTVGGKTANGNHVKRATELIILNWS
ncbi:MAG: DNA adenine methylase [Nitrospirota bacterium]|nr:DNA adenine methylase [Nitrospirota bacterium]